MLLALFIRVLIIPSFFMAHTTSLETCVFLIPSLSSSISWLDETKLISDALSAWYKEVSISKPHVVQWCSLVATLRLPGSLAGDGMVRNGIVEASESPCV